MTPANFPMTLALEVDIIWWVLAIVLVLVGVFLLVTAMKIGGLYIQALLNGARVSIVDLIGMRIRGTDAHTLVNAHIQARRAGLDVAHAQMEAHVIAGGDLPRVIAALIAASKAKIDLSWKLATEIDLSGRNVLEAVHLKVHDGKPLA